MGISFSGVGSGLPTGDWINALMAAESAPLNRLYQKSSALETSKTTFNTIESKFSSLRSNIERFTDANIVSAFDIFGRNKASSSDDSIIKATVSNNATVQELKMKVSQLATSTQAKSVNTPGMVSTGDTKITELGNFAGKNGTFTIYTDNQKHEFELTGESGSETINDVINMINTEFSGGEITASLTAEGKFKLEVDNGQVSDVRLGANNDTSNVFNVLKLEKIAIDDQVPTDPGNIDYFESSKTLSSVNIGGILVGNDANLNTEVTAGTFTIGDAEFTIDDSTTLSGLISEINSNEDAGVTASFDVTNNQFVLNAKDAGAITINVESGTSNFTEVMGLTSGSGLATGSQTLGNNAIIEINGENIEANTNTVGSDITGINGLTLNLLGTTSDAEGETSEVDINIQKDTGDLIKAVEDFISKYNEISDEVSKHTSFSGNLKSESSLRRLQSDLRMTAMNNIEGLDTYSNLASIGISTGAFGASISDNTNHLQLDKDKLLEAISKNPNEVRALFIGDEDKGITGIMQSLEDKVESALDIENGYFRSRKDSYDSMISDIDKSITKKNEYLDSYRERLVKQFASMDQYIAQLQSQSAALSMF